MHSLLVYIKGFFIHWLKIRFYDSVFWGVHRCLYLTCRYHNGFFWKFFLQNLINWSKIAFCHNVVRYLGITLLKSNSEVRIDGLTLKMINYKPVIRSCKNHKHTCFKGVFEKISTSISLTTINKTKPIAVPTAHSESQRNPGQCCTVRTDQRCIMYQLRHCLVTHQQASISRAIHRGWMLSNDTVS